MGKVIQLPSKSKSHTKQMNEQIAKNEKDRETFLKALSEMKEQTGLDFYKIVIGNEAENAKLRFKQRQASLIDD